MKMLFTPHSVDSRRQTQQKSPSGYSKLQLLLVVVLCPLIVSPLGVHARKNTCYALLCCCASRTAFVCCDVLRFSVELDHGGCCPAEVLVGAVLVLVAVLCPLIVSPLRVHAWI